MRELGADYGIHGEGEGPLAELIGALERGETGADIPAVYTRDGRTGNGPMGNGPAKNRLSENTPTENTPTGNERTENGRRSYLRILISTGGACARWTPKSSPKTSSAPSAITA